MPSRPRLSIVIPAYREQHLIARVDAVRAQVAPLDLETEILVVDDGSTLPLRLVTLIGFLSLVLASLLGAQTLWQWMRGVAVSGFTTVILLQLVIGSTILLGLGVIGENLGRIYNETKRRPRYVAMERCGRAER